jgi:hypothetical protein
MKLADKMFLVLLFSVGGIAIVLLKTGFIFLILALLPSVIAYYIDQNHSKPFFKIVFAWNFAATLPSLIPLVKAGIDMKPYGTAVVMGNPTVWLFIYCGAAVGWCLSYLCRFIARFIVAMLYDYRVFYLENLQKKLVDEWGKQISEKAP